MCGASVAGEVGFNDGDSLLVFVVGASGDLAKKKTFPALLELYLAGLLPRGTLICGYARSKLTDTQFRVRGSARSPVEDALFPGAGFGFLPMVLVKIRGETLTSRSRVRRWQHLVST